MSGTDERLRREIEILRARGLDASAIIDLGYTPTRVANTFTAQDALLEEDDRRYPQPVPTPVNTAVCVGKATAGSVVA